MDGFLVIVPDPKWGWLTVCDLNSLVDYLNAGDPVQDAVDNAGIDMPMGDPARMFAAVRRANNGGDYWTDPDDQEGG